MELYTLETTKKDFNAGLLSLKEFNLINEFIETRDKYRNAQELLEIHYNEKFSSRINSSTIVSELKDIKEELRTMPESVGKVLLFRHILMKEDDLLNINI